MRSLTEDYYFIVNENSIWHRAGNHLPRSTAMKKSDSNEFMATQALTFMSWKVLALFKTCL